MSGRKDIMPPKPPRGAEEGRAVPIMNPNPEEALKLLPQTHQQFATRTYWDQFFNKLREQDGRTGAFEWYGSWSDFADQVETMSVPAETRENAKVLVVGCGNSTLSEDMYAAGFHQVTSIDFSEVVIEEMRARATDKPGLKYEVMDFLAMESSWDKTFDLVFDKGALDALMTDESAVEQGSKMLAEIERVLRPGGSYLCVTLAQEHILQLLVEKFQPSSGFTLEVRAFDPAAGSNIAPFLIRAHKSAENPTLAVFPAPGQPGQSVETREELEQAVEDRRLVYHMQRNIQTKGRGLRARFALWDASMENASTPRFLVSIVDSDRSLKDAAIPCAVFLVPQGREHEWTFASEEGQLQVASSNGIARLIVISLGRNHTFESIEAVQAELSPSMSQLYPEGLEDAKVPYVTLGPDLGTRKSVAKEHSELSGELIIEDVEIADEDSDKTLIHRRLVFLNASDVIQSEARIIKHRNKKPANKKGGKAKKGGNSKGLTFKVDKSFLAFEFHRAMVSGLFFLPSKQDAPARTVVVGLGGGALASYLASQCSWYSGKTDVQAVELDPIVLQTAKNWFDFSDKDINVHIGDGAEWINETAKTGEQSFDTIFLDVDAKDLSQPIFFPPRSFLEQGAIDDMKKILTDDGLLITNLACKSAGKRDEILKMFREQFAQVLCIPLQAIGDTNCIVFAFKGKVAAETPKELRALAIKKAKSVASGDKAPQHDFAEILDDLHSVDDNGGLVSLK
mmetsp:Transcript_1915/g.4362  ORF Transcript_1915/g.4362 Transcript_1915/m.4362 type:complete len:737 (+) Transcript_1915:294-2504(+)